MSSLVIFSNQSIDADWSGRQAVLNLRNSVFWHVTPVVLVRTDISEELIASIISVLQLLVTA
jgi:hypothetical protein